MDSTFSFCLRQQRRVNIQRSIYVQYIKIWKLVVLFLYLFDEAFLLKMSSFKIKENVMSFFAAVLLIALTSNSYTYLTILCFFSVHFFSHAMRIVSHSRLICRNINHSLIEIQQNMLMSCVHLF